MSAACALDSQSAGGLWRAEKAEGGLSRPSQPCEGSIRARGVRSLVKHQEAAAVCVDARELRPGVRNRHPPAVQQGQRLAKLVEVQPAVVGEVHLIEEEEQLDVCPNRQACMSAWWGGEGAHTGAGSVDRDGGAGRSCGQRVEEGRWTAVRAGRAEACRKQEDVDVCVRARCRG
jgi:hypothetical protein